MSNMDNSQVAAPNPSAQNQNNSKSDPKPESSEMETEAGSGVHSASPAKSNPGMARPLLLPIIVSSQCIVLHTRVECHPNITLTDPVSNGEWTFSHDLGPKGLATRSSLGSSCLFISSCNWAL